MTQYATDFSKFFSKFPVIDISGLLASQQKNLDALIEAGNVVAETTQTLLKRQAELVQSSIEDGVAVAKESFGPKGFDMNGFQKQLDYAKTSAEKTFASAREFAEIANKSNTQAVEILRKRATEGLGEFTQIVKNGA